MVSYFLSSEEKEKSIAEKEAMSVNLKFQQSSYPNYKHDKKVLSFNQQLAVRYEFQFTIKYVYRTISWNSFN